MILHEEGRHEGVRQELGNVRELRNKVNSTTPGKTNPRELTSKLSGPSIVLSSFHALQLYGKAATLLKKQSVASSLLCSLTKMRPFLERFKEARVSDWRLPELISHAQI